MAGKFMGNLRYYYPTDTDESSRVSNWVNLLLGNANWVCGLFVLLLFFLLDVCVSVPLSSGASVRKKTRPGEEVSLLNNDGNLELRCTVEQSVCSSTHLYST